MFKSGFETSPETWKLWTRVVSVNDFKKNTVVGLSEFSALDDVTGGKAYKYGQFSDKQEQFSIGTYGKLFAINREAIINDDLNVLTSIPQSFGRAAARTIGNVVYGVLTTNAALSDTVALFHTDHKNLGTGAPTVANFDLARTKMVTQKDISGTATLNIVPKYVLTPTELEGVSKVIVSSQYDPTSTKNANVPNMVHNIATVISDPRLSLNSATEWYMVADPNIFDTVVVALLEGKETPVLEQQAGWTIDGVEYKVRIDCGAAAIDHRGMFKSSGV